MTNQTTATQATPTMRDLFAGAALSGIMSSLVRELGSVGHQHHASADEKAGLLNHYCGPGQTDCPTLSDDYDLDVGLAGALQ